PGAAALVERCRRTGARQVLVTGAIDLTILPLARHFGVDDVIATEMEFVGNGASGRIKKPLLASGVKAAAVRDYCAKNGLDLSACWGFCVSYADYPMLAVVGRPVAVNPDFRLRAMARTHDWPVVELR